MPCEWCGEDITLADEPARRLGVLGADGKARLGYVHNECQLREALGGIGHLIAHDYWCLQMHDPNAGLTRRQSAKLAMKWFEVVGLPTE